MNIGDVPQLCLRVFRTRAGLSIRDVGFLLGYTDHTMVSKIENGVKQPGLWELVLIELLFEASPGDLFPMLKDKGAAFLIERIEDYRTFDRGYKKSKALVRSSLTNIHLDRILASLRRHVLSEMESPQEWQDQADTS